MTDERTHGRCGLRPRRTVRAHAAWFAALAAITAYPATVAAQTATGDSAAGVDAELPHVSMDYSPVFDGACTELSGEQVDPEWVRELNGRLDEFRDHWRREAPALLRTTVEVVGRPFPFRETEAALVLCGVPSMSLPLIMNMRHYLAAVHGDDASPPSLFTATLYHELLHRYVHELLSPGPTPLTLKYVDDPLVIRAHLHLYAIMAEVYRTLGRDDDFRAVLAADARLSPVAERVWEIVQREGADAFVREVREARSATEPGS